MGQKVNPIGFRTGIMIGWKSRWYASKQEFADLLIEDQRIRRYVKTSRTRSASRSTPAIPKVEIERTRDEVKVVLYTARPGIIIGRKGQEVERLQKRAAGADRAADQHQDRGDQPAGDGGPVGGRGHRRAIGEAGQLPPDDEAGDGNHDGRRRQGDQDSIGRAGWAGRKCPAARNRSPAPSPCRRCARKSITASPKRRSPKGTSACKSGSTKACITRSDTDGADAQDGSSTEKAKEDV